MPQDFSGFLIRPSTFGGIDNAASIMERQREKEAQYAYQNRKDQEQEDYRKAGMLDDVNVNEKLTGIPEIDRVFQEKTRQVYDDLVAKSRNMSFVDLKGEINKRMQPIMSGLNEARTSYQQGEKIVNGLVGQVKQLDRAGLLNAVTDQVKNQFLDRKGNLIPNPNPVDFSNLSNENYLSDFMTGTDALKSAFDASKGKPYEWSVDIPGGTRTLKTTVPFYINPTVSTEELMANGMRPPKGKEVAFPVAGESRVLEGSNTPVRLMDENVMNTILNDLPTRLSFNKAFKESHPGWEKFTPLQLSNIQRAFMADYAQTNGIQPAQISGTHYFPVTHNTTKVYTGGGENQTINDIHQDVVDTVGDKGSAEFRRLRPDTQSTILKYLNDNYRTKQDDSFTPDNVQIEKQGEQYYVVDPKKTDNDGQHFRLMPLDRTALNVKVQPTAKDKQKVIEEGNKKNTQKVSKNNPLGLDLD